ncbi:MAG: O-antigen ligase family protein [Cyanobacteria bacterium P01_A01_bin.15]
MGASNRLTVYDGLLGLGLLGLAVFAWLPDSFFRMVSWPWVLVWQSAFLLVAGGGLWQLRRLSQPFYGLGFGLDWLVVALAASLVVSSTVSPFPRLALQNSLVVGCYVSLLYGVRNSRFNPMQLCQGLVWVGAIAAVVSLALWRPTPDMWLSDNFYDAIRNRFPLGHHNFTGGYFVLVLPLAAGMAWLHSGWRRWGYGVMGLVIAAALYASGSRGAWLGGVALVSLALVYGIWRSRGRARLGAVVLSSLMLCLVLVLLGSNPRMRSLVPTSLWSAPESHGVIADGPARDRFFMAQAGVSILKNRPWGLGPGNLGRVYERYRPLAAGTGLNQVQQLHNTPVQIAVELGLAGALLYLGLVVCLVRLGRQLQTQERRLSLVLAMGFVGYGVSSLSDYQLENIPIAVTLSVLLAALTQLGGALSPVTISQRTRRWGSLLALATIALMVQFWLRTDLALWMTHQGLAAIDEGDLIRADEKFYTAAAVAPWDPTPIALGAQQLSELAQTATGDSQETLRQEAMTLYQQVLRVAPNDIWFNQNFAVLAWQSGDVAAAHGAIAKVVQLSPRSKNHSYYLLGLTYQAMGNPDAAIEALALECLINPQVVTFESWYQELAPVREAVFNRALQHYQTVLSGLGAEHPLHSGVEIHMTTLRWWAGFDSNADPVPKIVEGRPLLHTLLTLGKNPDQAAILLERCIADFPSDGSRCRLLRAWLQPETYLSDYLKNASLSSDEQAALRSHITTHRRIKDWLRSTTIPVSNNQRVALALLYRSYYARKISSLLVPENLRQFSLPTSLGLFALAWPRELPPLDNLVETVRADTLGLPHPTRNGFEFTTPSGSNAS